MLTSIIILTNNQLEYTKQCLQSIRTYTGAGTYEVIFVDNASDDGTREWLQAQQNIQLILNDEDIGYPKGYNQGIEIANGDNILFLNTDAIVTENWLENLIACLYSDKKIGAVGPVNNQNIYFNAIQTDYNNFYEMQEFAKQHNQSSSEKWEQRVRLLGNCMLIKKDVVNKVGLLDDLFSPGYYEDADYSYRIECAGYRLMICKDTFIHMQGEHYSFDEKRVDKKILKYKNGKKFERKWGFSSDYSSSIRVEMLELIEEECEKQMNVLEVGCATGGTLIEVKNRFNNANVFGIEINPNSAAIAQQFIDVRAGNVEKDIDYPIDFFDYIIFGDVIEHLYDPWKVLDNLRKYLKDDGFILISIPNVMHYSLLSHVVNGNWTYQDYGLLDRTHIRFFTLNELDKMLKGAYYNNINYTPIMRYSEDEYYDKFINHLINITNETVKPQYLTFQYLVKANKIPEKKVEFEKEVNRIIEEIDYDRSVEENQLQLIQYILEDIDNNITLEKQSNPLIEDSKSRYIIESIFNNSLEPIKILLGLALKGFEKKLDFNLIMTFVYSAYEIDKEHPDTLYNLAYILASYGQHLEAINYLKNAKTMDAELKALYHYLEQSLEEK